MNPTMYFSVVIPLYNKGPYVEDTIRSLIAQTLQPLEVLVVDDGSTDDGPQRALALGYPCLRLIRQENAGVAAARNIGIAAARGDYVCFLDADDWYMPGFLAALKSLAIRYPSAGVLATSYHTLQASGRRRPVPLHASVRQVGVVDDFYRAWSVSSFCFTSSIAVRRDELAPMAAPFPVGERLGEDQDLWFRLAEQCTLAFDPAPLSTYRLDVAGSATAGGVVLDELPAFQRLGVRLHSHAVPRHMRRSAARLYASHLLNIARARAGVRNAQGAWEMLRRPAVRANPFYWLRTVAYVLSRHFPHRGAQP